MKERPLIVAGRAMVWNKLFSSFRKTEPRERPSSWAWDDKNGVLLLVRNLMVGLLIVLGNVAINCKLRRYILILWKSLAEVADNRSVTQGISRFLWNPKVNYLFTQVNYWMLAWARLMQFMYSHLISLRIVLMLSCHVRLGSHFPFRFQDQSSDIFLFRPCFLNFPPFSFSLISSFRNIWWKAQIIKSSLYNLFTFLSLHPSRIQMFPSAPCPHSRNVKDNALLPTQNSPKLHTHTHTHTHTHIYIYIYVRSQWSRGLRRRSAAARLRRLRVRIPPGLLWVLYVVR
jgi:hypothetical protein